MSTWLNPSWSFAFLGCRLAGRRALLHQSILDASRQTGALFVFGQHAEIDLKEWEAGPRDEGKQV